MTSDAETPSDLARRGSALLLVGDDSDALDHLRGAALAAGFECEHTADLQHVRAQLLMRAYAAAVVDLDRRDGDGVSLLATVRRFGPELWIVALLPPALFPTPTMGYDVALAKPAAPRTVIEALARMPS